MMLNWLSTNTGKTAVFGDILLACPELQRSEYFGHFFLEKSFGRPAPPLHHRTPARTLKQPARVTVTEKCLPQHNATGLSKY